MKNFFKPSVMLINRLKYPQKLILIGAIFVIIVLILAYQLSSQSIAKIRFSERELIGLEINQPIMFLTQKLQEYRTIKDLHILKKADEQELRDARVGVDQAIIKLSTIIEQKGEFLNINDRWEQIKNEWDNMKHSSENIPEYGQKTDITPNIQRLILQVCDNANLTIDPQLDSYYLADAYCSLLPKFSELLRNLQDLGTTVLIQNNLSSEDADYLNVTATLLTQFGVPNIQINIERATTENSDLYYRLNVLENKLISETALAMQSLNENVIRKNFDYPVEQYNKTFGDIEKTTDELINETSQIISELIKVRIKKNILEFTYNILIVTVGLAIFIYLFMGIYFSILQSIRQLINGSDQIAKGNLEAKVKLETHDELSQVADSFNSMQETLLNIVSELQKVVTAVAHGNLSQRVDLKDKEGFAHELSSNINKMSDVFQDIIKDINTVLDYLSKGNLTIRVTREYQGEFADLKTYVNNTIDDLSKLINDIKMATETIRNAAEEIALGNIDLEKRTDQQAASLEETSASVSNITSTVQKTTKNAKGAHDLALSASNIALEGGGVVNKVVEMMNTINDSARQVSDISNLIDGIAFQTNILALNAAVEAARAGEQGKGFSVVATEIRNLAQRSSVSAQGIKTLINAAVEQISGGKKLADEAGKTMNQVVESVKNVTEKMSNIVNASVEQTHGIQQVNIAIAQMDEVTQQNSALVEEAARSSESLKEQAEHMKNLVNLFKVFAPKIETLPEPPITKKITHEKIKVPLKKPKIPPVLPSDTTDEWSEF